MAAAVDTIVLAVAIFVVVIAIILLDHALGEFFHDAVASWLSNVETAIGVALVTIIFLGYYVFFDVVWSGQSPGKRLVRIRVVHAGGYPVTLVDSVTRNVVRFIDFLPSMYVLGAVVMFIHPQSRRLGDIVAGTLVVKEGRSAKLADLVEVSRERNPTSERERSSLAALSNQDRYLVEEFLRRRSHLAAPHRAAVAKSIAKRLQQYLGPDVTTLEPEVLLERLAMKEIDTSPEP